MFTYVFADALVQCGGTAAGTGRCAGRFKEICLRCWSSSRAPDQLEGPSRPGAGRWSAWTSCPNSHPPSAATFCRQCGVWLFCRPLQSGGKADTAPTGMARAMSGSPQELARACSRWCLYGCPASGLMSLDLPLPDGERGQSGEPLLMCARIRGTNLRSGLGQHQSAEECIPAPSARRQCDGSGDNGSACRKEPVLLTLPTWASCRAREGVVRYTPCSFTPAMLWCLYE